MILPSKHLSEQRALIAVGSEILLRLENPRSASELWEAVRDARKLRIADIPLSFDWFTLALTFLFAVHAVEIDDGFISAKSAANGGPGDHLD